jgi:hypothetical protein
MNQENTMKLLKRFPVLYQDFYSDMRETCMCWGFECGDGWFDLIWMLSLAIEAEMNYSWWKKRWLLVKKGFFRRWNAAIYQLSPVTVGPRKTQDKDRLTFLKKLVRFPYTGVVASQVKEKFGTLRFYTMGNERIWTMVELAERASATTCEVCGEYGKVRYGGWIVTRCDACCKKETK